MAGNSFCVDSLPATGKFYSQKWIGCVLPAEPSSQLEGFPDSMVV